MPLAYSFLLGKLKAMQNITPGKHALLLESDNALAREIALFLSQQGFSVLAPATTKEALESIRNQRIDLAFLGDPPDRDSCFDLLREVVKASPMTYVVLITDASDKEVHSKAEGYGILGHIPRVFSRARAQQLIDKFIQISESL